MYLAFQIQVRGGCAVQKLLNGCKLNFSTFGGSYKVVDSESFNFYVLGFWASEARVSV